MPLICRREFLAAAAVGTLARAAPVQAGQIANAPDSTDMSPQDRTVQFVSDGLALTPSKLNDPAAPGDEDRHVAGGL